MQKLIIFLVLFLSNAIALGQTVDLPEKITVQPGRLAAVTIKSDGDDTVWTVIPSANIDIFREFDTTSIKLRLLSDVSGDYYLIVTAVKNNKIAQKTCLISIGVPVPPTPPTPPNPLIQNLKVAFASDSSTNKDNELTALTTLYSQVPLDTLNTYGELWNYLKMTSVALGCNGKLKGVQQIIAQQMALENIPTNASQANDAIDRIKLTPALQKIVTLLRSIK